MPSPFAATTAFWIACFAFAPALAAAGAPGGAHEEQLQTCAHLARDHANDAVTIANAVLADAAAGAEVEIRALACLGIAQAARGEPAKATASAERALRLIDAHPLLDGEAAYALGQVGGVFQTAGQPQRAAKLYQRAYELTRRDGSPR
ncbi:MAG TPA: hypothetical protein VGC30_09080, partial [Dokdonella sp.]